MRKLRMITTQDHIIIVLECDEVNDEMSCMSSATGTRIVLEDSICAAFVVEGTVQHFTEDSDGDWVATDLTTAPDFQILKEGIPLGCMSPGDFSRTITFYPKDDELLRKFPDTRALDEELLDAIRDVDREKFVTLISFQQHHKINPETFQRIDEDDDMSKEKVVFT